MRYKILFLICAIFCFAFPFSEADKKKSKPAPKKKIKREYPPMKMFVEGLKKIDGFYTLYHKKEKLYAAIQTSQLNKLFLMAFSISGGPEFTGWQWGHMLVKWEKVGKNLLLVRPNIRQRMSRKNTISEILKKTYTASVIHAVRILSIEGGRILVDCNHLFKRDLAEIKILMGMIMGGGSLNSNLSSWSKIKNFKDNLEIEVNATFTGGGSFARFAEFSGLIADSRGARMNIHYSLSKLPRSNYKPRRADDRVGYFMTVYKDHSKPYGSKTSFVRYINRWHLEKADKSLELSPPKKPIIFYIEKTVPVRYRRYVKAGILEWNKAFEKIGIIDAIIVRQQTDKEFNDLDPEDVRYNFFRWITSGHAYAMGPSRANPLTGQILDADIVFDDSFTRFSHAEFHVWGKDSLRMMFKNDTLAKFEKLPIWKTFIKRKYTNEMKLRWKKLFKNPRWQKRWGYLEHKCGKCDCQYSLGKTHQMALASLVLKAKGKKGKKVPEEYLGQVIKEVVMHEVGHTLGLRHNFKGSTFVKLKDLNKANGAPSITTASVMDYVATNFALKNEKQGVFQSKTIGPYDYWAIEYGYAFPKKGEEKLLKSITDKVATKGLEYATDEDTSFLDPDPHAARWDLGDDLVDFASSRYTLYGELRNNLLKRAVNDGESYFYARRYFSILMSNYLYASMLVSKYVGGEYVYRDHKGDPKARAPFVAVAPKKQRQALTFLAENLWSGKSLHFTPEILNHLAPGRWGHWGSNEFNSWIPVRIHEEILWTQFMPMMFILAPWSLERIHDIELKIDPNKDAVTIPEVFETLTKSVFSEFQTKVPARKHLPIVFLLLIV